MGKFLDAVKAGVKAAAYSLGPGPYSVAGRQVRCSHCGGTDFLIRRAPVDHVTNVLPLSAHALLCQSCSHIEFFGDPPDRL